MAFMMPVMKNDYNIYKSNRNRRVSECSNNDKTAGSSSSCGGRRVHSGSRSADGPSLSTSPGSDGHLSGSPAHRSLGAVSSRPSAFHHHHHGGQHQHAAASKSSSRNSQNSLLQSPAKSSSSSSSSPPPPKLSSASSLNMFHLKLVDKLRRSLTSKSKDSGATTTSSSKDIARRRS